MFYKFALYLVRFALHFIFRVKYVGRENMPKEGACLLAVNHRSYWDPVMAGAASPRPLTFMAKEELFKNPIFGKLIKSLGAFPVNRHGGEIGAIKSAFKILGEGRVMLMFPEGRRVTDGTKGKAKPGVAMIAQRCRVPVIPMFISGEYKWMRKITITIGKPIDLSEYYGKKLNAEQLQKIADNIFDTMWSYKVD